MAYDTVYRHSELEFTGISTARLFRKHWYWPDYKTARDFALAHNLPTDRTIQYSKGWAIQLYKSGPYVSAPLS
jgi:hypothetical protein